MENIKNTDFSCDYNCGAAPEVLNAIISSNSEQTATYGEDIYCAGAKEKIKKAIGNDNADIYFMIGGTQTNAIAIDALLNRYEGVISAKSGHIAQHESGAVEFCGHKVIEVENDTAGRIVISSLEAFLETFYNDPTYEHMVLPGAVYISHPTEFGGLYTNAQLKALRSICDKYNMRLYLDGARLAYAVAAEDTDVTLKDIAAVCDAFYIGGTKCGTLFGEALVFRSETTAPHFFTTRKQHGGLLAKGRMLGLQFDALFTDDLYFKLGKNAIDKAMLLKKGLEDRGVSFFAESPTNQQFLIVSNQKLEELEGRLGYSLWSRMNSDNSVIRLCSSWATTDEDIEYILSLF